VALGVLLLLDSVQSVLALADGAGSAGDREPALSVSAFDANWELLMDGAGAADSGGPALGLFLVDARWPLMDGAGAGVSIKPASIIGPTFFAEWCERKNEPAGRRACGTAAVGALARRVLH